MLATPSSTPAAAAPPLAEEPAGEGAPVSAGAAPPGAEPAYESESAAPARLATSAERARLHALPIGLHEDLLYLWATFRLRYRPFKMLGLLFVLGGACYAWQWFGERHGGRWLGQQLAVLPPGFIRDSLLRTAGAVFSSLNLLSCIGIFIMAWTLRHLLKEGHIEALLLVPRRMRPSALFYAVATRYLPLAFVAVLVIYLDRDRSPFRVFPFNLPPGQDLPPSPWPIYWAAAKELSILFFCPTNMFSDLAITYWIFSRWRVTWPVAIWTVVVIGLVSPVGLMMFHETVNHYVERHIWDRSGLFALLPQAAVLPSDVYTVRHIAMTAHYFATGLVTGLLGWAALLNLDFRWRRIERSATLDPILLKQVD